MFDEKHIFQLFLLFNQHLCGLMGVLSKFGHLQITVQNSQHKMGAVRGVRGCEKKTKKI